MRLARSLRLLAATAVAATGLTAASAAVATTGASAASLPTCPLSALAKASGVTDITFWNSALQANQTTLQAIVNTFNASQSKIHVTLVQQPSYDDTWTKYTAGLTNGNLPDVVQLEDQRTQQAIDTQSFLPVQSCMNASHYATSDYLTRALDYWKVNGVQEALPFAVSNPVLYYNKLAFTKAGIAAPPATLAAFVADAKTLKAAGSGTALVLDSWDLETWLATANTLFVNKANGRASRATAGVFDNAAGKTIFSALNTLVSGGYATTNPATGPDAYDNLLGIGSGKYAMTIDTSADLGTVTQVLASGSYPNVSLGVAPFPVFSSAIRGGIEPGGSGVYISDKVPAVQQAASWDFLEYLMDTQSVAQWAAGTGYIPVRKSSTQTALIQKLWTTDPNYKVAYNQQLNGANTPATAGAVIGPYEDVRTDILTAEQSMFTGGVAPAAALSQAESTVNNTISTYNQRLGVG